MFVYVSPLVGGWIADKKLGYRRAVMIRGLFFMAGHLLLSIRSMTAVYAALTCLVIGIGFFKPNVSAIGQLWDDWLHSTFWIFCSACALFMAFILLILLRPLKKAMPGV